MGCQKQSSEHTRQLTIVQKTMTDSPSYPPGPRGVERLSNRILAHALCVVALLAAPRAHGEETPPVQNLEAAVVKLAEASISLLWGIDQIATVVPECHLVNSGAGPKQETARLTAGCGPTLKGVSSIQSGIARSPSVGVAIHPGSTCVKRSDLVRRLDERWSIATTIPYPMTPRSGRLVSGLWHIGMATDGIASQVAVIDGPNGNPLSIVIYSFLLTDCIFEVAVIQRPYEMAH